MLLGGSAGAIAGTVLGGLVGPVGSVAGGLAGASMGMGTAALLFHTGGGSSAGLDFEAKIDKCRTQ